MTKTPNSRRNLDEAIRRVAGLDASYVKTRTIVANTIVGQMLPEGLVKGGSALKLRFGDTATRFTTDLDVARRNDLDSFVGELGEQLAQGWNEFIGNPASFELASLQRGNPFHHDVCPQLAQNASQFKPQVTAQPVLFDTLRKRVVRHVPLARSPWHAFLAHTSCIRDLYAPKHS